MDKVEIKITLPDRPGLDVEKIVKTMTKALAWKIRDRTPDLSEGKFVSEDLGLGECCFIVSCGEHQDAF